MIMKTGSSLHRSGFAHGHTLGLRQRLRLNPVAAALLAALGIVSGGAQAASTTITVDTAHRTNTVITPNANHFKVTTTTTSGKTAFNSFSQFDLASGDTVDLHMPSSTHQLVNLVWDSRANINGTLNSYIGNNQTSITGGSVYFADPHGIVVGSDAVLNVGSLSLSAPTTDFMQSLLDGNGALDLTSENFDTLLQGKEPLAKSSVDGTSACGDYMICIAGKINAKSAVRVRATSIDASGTIYVEGDGSDEDLLGTSVNVEGSSTPTLVRDGNTIRLIASDDDSVQIGDAGAHAAVNISGTLQTATADRAEDSAASEDSWGLIRAAATSTAHADFTAPKENAGKFSLLTKQAGDLLKDPSSLSDKGFEDAAVDANLAAGDKLGHLGYVRASATANVSVTGTIQAAGDVSLASTTDTSATTDATAVSKTSDGEGGSVSSLPFMVSAMYGGVYSQASTHVLGSASIAAGGGVDVTAGTENKLDVEVDTEADENQLFSGTIAWSQAAVQANATVDGIVTGEGLNITAHNQNEFATKAVASTSKAGGSVGIAGAVSEQTVVANAALNSSPDITATDTGGNVTVAAGTTTEGNETSALTTSGEYVKPRESAVSSTDASMSDTLANKSNAGLNEDGSSSGDALPFHVGAAVSYTDSSNTANASIGPDVNITTPGNVVVYSSTEDADRHGGAVSETSSEAKEEGGSGTKATVSAAVNYGHYKHVSHASIGNNDVIQAARIGVGSDLDLPFDWTFGLGGNVDSIKDMGNSLDDFFDGVSNLRNLAVSDVLIEGITDHISGYASAAGGGDTDVAIGGSVNYVAIDNNNRAWVGDGAKLTSTLAATDDDAWTSTLTWDEDAKVDWKHSVSVQAQTDLAAFDLVGSIKLWEPSTEGEKAAIGGAFNYSGYKNSTVAGIGSGAVISSTNDVAVHAESKDTLFAVSPISGKGGSVGLQGTVALTDVDDTTHATVSAAADVTANALDVEAVNPLTVWALSGAVAMSNQASIGFSVGINNLGTDTVAAIGDNSADDPSATPTSTPVQTGGVVKVSTLGLQAATHGGAGALSVAGSAVTSESGGGGDEGGGEGGGEESKPPGSALLELIEKVGSVTGKLHTGLDYIGAIQNLGSGGGSGTSLQDTAGKALTAISEASEAAGSVGGGLSGLIGKASSIGSSKGGEAPTGGTASKGKSFGIGLSGAASVNMASLGSVARLDGANVQMADGGSGEVTVRGINDAMLDSLAGAASLKLSKQGKGGALAGAVAYSTVGNDTEALIEGASAVSKAGNVTLQALDGSQQIDVGIGAAVNTGNGGTSVTLAGSVSIATSSNTTKAAIQGGSTLAAATGAAATALNVTAYDHTRIGIGGGALYFNTSSGKSGNAGLGFGYADITNTTTAELTGHHGSDPSAVDIDGFDGITVQALDSSLIADAAVAGGFTAGKNSANLAGAILWNHIANKTDVHIDDGMRLQVGKGGLTAMAAAEAPDATLDQLLATPDAQGYDFAGTGLGKPDDAPSPGTAAGQDKDSNGKPVDPAQPTLDLGTAAPGSSIIAVAGTLQIGGNNVGLSYVGNKVENTHNVYIGDAHIDTNGGKVSLKAKDDTRIVGLAVGAALSTGKFAGVGSATTNQISNQDQVLIGSASPSGNAAWISADSVDIEASDDSHIYSLAGNVAIGTGQLAAGGALTYNDVSNTVSAHAGATTFDVAGGDVTVNAAENAQIMAGAVAAAATKGTSLSLSFGWNQSGNKVTAGLDDGSVVTANSLGIGATDAATIYALSGGVAIGGKVAVGLAASVADIDDTTHAYLEDTGLDISRDTDNNGGDVSVVAKGTGLQYTLAVAGSAGGKGAGAGSVTYNTIGSDNTATISDVYGVDNDVGATSAAAQAASLTARAENDAGIYSLAGGIAIGGNVGVGAAASVNDIGGSTSADIDDSTLDIADATTVKAVSNAIVKTAAVAGGASGSIAGGLSNTTNLIGNTISAGMSGVSTANGSSAANHYEVDSNNVTTIGAVNNASISSLAGAVGGAGSVAVGAAVAVNRIGTQTTAGFQGGGLYESRDFNLYADAGNPNAGDQGNAANINTIAVGAALGGDVGASGSVAVNIMGGDTEAGISGNANVIAKDNVAVLATSQQGINVLAGAASLGGYAGVGVGVVVNDIHGTTKASIEDSKVSAYGLGDAVNVDSGTPEDAADLAGSIGISNSDSSKDGGHPELAFDRTNYTAPDLSGVQTAVHGVAVNASNQQHIATLGIGAAVSGGVGVGLLAGVNVIGGTTSAGIDDSQINQADLYTVNSGSCTTSPCSAGGTFHAYAAGGQQVDVRAGSRQYEANFVLNAAVSGGFSATGSAAVNVFNAATTAAVTDSTLWAKDGTNVIAAADQWSLATSAGLAASANVGAAATGAVTVFKADTQALVDDADISGGSKDGDGLDVLASDNTYGAQIGMAAGIGVATAGVSGVALVNVDQVNTSAVVEGGSTITTVGAVNVKATTSNTVQAVAASAAFGTYAGVAGGVVVNVIDNNTHACVLGGKGGSGGPCHGDASGTGSAIQAGQVAIEAHDSQALNAYAGSLGGGFVGVGGGINLAMLQATVGAGVSGSKVTAVGGNGEKGDVLVRADSTRNVDAVAASGGIGVVGAGLSASVLVAGTGDITDGGDADAQGDLNAGKQTNLSAADNQAGSNPLQTDNGSPSDAYHLSPDDNSQGHSDGSDGRAPTIDFASINHDAGYDLSAATGSDGSNFGGNDGVQTWLASSTVAANGRVDLDAEVYNTTSNTAGGASVGAVAVGGALAYTTLNTDVSSTVDVDSTVKANEGVSIQAGANDGGSGPAAKTEAYAGTGGAVGIGAAVAVSHVDNTVTATGNGTIQSFDDTITDGLAIHAVDTSSVVAGNDNLSGINVGGFVAGAVIDDALRSSAVTASIGNGASISDMPFVDVYASDSGLVKAEGVMGQGGVAAAISAVVSNASDHSTVTAKVGDKVHFTDVGTAQCSADASRSGSGVCVTAAASPDAKASAKGINIAGGLGMGANVALGSIEATVKASVGDNVVFGVTGDNTPGDLYVQAKATPTTSVTTNGGAGGILAGVNASVSTATNNSTVAASVGDAVTLPGGNVTIAAVDNTSQSASATGDSGGIVSAGAAVAKASSDTTTTASLGDGVVDGTGDPVSQATAGNLSITASGEDSNDAHATAGSGGLVSGNASKAITSATSVTTADVGQNQKLDNLASFTLTAIHQATHDSSADSHLVAAVGGAGADVDNDATSTTSTSIGDGSDIETGRSLYVESQSQFGGQAAATGGAGGIVAGQAAHVTASPTATNTTTVGDNVTLMSGLRSSPSVPGNLVLLADTSIEQLDNTATLTVDGGVPIANAVTDVEGTFTSTVNVGSSSTLSSDSRLNIATYAKLHRVGSEATANTGGVGTVGTSSATANLTSHQYVNIGAHTNLSSLDETDIIAGKDVLDGIETELNPLATAAAFVRGLIAIPDASATSHNISTASLVLGDGSNVISGSNVGIGAMQGEKLIQVDGTGHGYELGFIPVTQHDSDQDYSGQATSTINGDVLAGRYNKIALVIDENGDLSSYEGAQDIVFTRFDAPSSQANCNPTTCFNPTLFLNKLGGQPAGAIQQGMDNQYVGAYVFQPMAVDGGDVFLFGSSVTGNGSITANGAPSLSVVNHSPYYLVFLDRVVDANHVVPAINVGFGSSGRVLVSGGASLSQVQDAGITVQQVPSGTQPSVTITSDYATGQNKTPGIILDDVSNLGGSVTITDKAGSLQQIGTISANSQTINVPNGSVVFNNINQDWRSGQDPESLLGAGLAQSCQYDILQFACLTNNLWTKLYGMVSSPNNVAAAIAQSWYATDNLYRYHNGNSSHPNHAYDTDSEYTPVILYGSCYAEVGGSDNDGCSGSNSGGLSLVLPSDDGRWAPSIPDFPLHFSDDLGLQASLAASSSSVVTRTLSVTARYINIDSPIYVGTPATWTVKTTDALKTWMGQQHGTTPIPIPEQLLTFNTTSLQVETTPLLKVLANAPDSRLIHATYNPANGQIVLDNINASGGGTAYFDGRIVSTGNGSIHVNSGLGSVTVDNTTGHPLTVKNIFTGDGGLGLITFVDRLDTWSQGEANGKARITWYVSQQGGDVQRLTNYDADTDTYLGDPEDWKDGFAAAYSDTYDPLHGEEYHWSASTGVQRANGARNWTWSSSTGGSVAAHWDIKPGKFIAPVNGSYKDSELDTNDFTVNVSGKVTDSYEKWLWYHGCDDDYGSECHYGTHATGYSDDQGSWHSQWGFIYPTAGTLTLDVKQRADLPIGIHFTSSDKNQVAINSNADIRLSGVISNAKGPTYINATDGGSIIQADNDALIWTHDLAMTTQGGGSIGSAATPIQVRIVHDGKASYMLPGVDSGILSLHTDGGDIAVDVDSGSAAQRFSAAAVGTAGGRDVYGDVTIDGTGSLLGLPGNDTVSSIGYLLLAKGDPYPTVTSMPADVIGGNITLVSQFGSIGSMSDPLTLSTHPTLSASGTPLPGTGVLRASANGDIALDDVDGDLWVKSVASTNGDVLLKAPQGGIYDADQLTASSTLSAQQTEAIWQKLHLTDGHAVDNAIKATETLVENDYTRYWQLLDVGAVDANGVYTLGGKAPDGKLLDLYWPRAAAANHLDPNDPGIKEAQKVSLTQDYVGDLVLDLYWPLAAAANDLDPNDPNISKAQRESLTQTYAGNLYDSIVATFDADIGDDWRDSDAFRNGQVASGWYTINSTSGQMVTRFDPVTKKTVQVDLYTWLTKDASWTDDQLRYAINLNVFGATDGTPVGKASPNISGHDVELVAGAGGIGNDAAPVTIDYQQFKDLSAEKSGTGTTSGLLTEEQIKALGLANTPGDVTLLDADGNELGVTLDAGGVNGTELTLNGGKTVDDLATISIRQTAPLFVDATGAVSGSASGTVYLQSGTDLHLGGIKSGDDMRLAAGGSIDAASGSTGNDPVLTADGDLVIDAGGGHISFGNGNATNPGDPLPIQVNGTLSEASAAGDILLKQVQGDLRIKSVKAGGLASLATADGNLFGTLDAVGVRGRGIRLTALGGGIGGALDGSSTMNAPLYVQEVGDVGLDATADQKIWLDSPQDTFAVNTVHGGDDVVLTAENADLDADEIVSDRGSITASAATDSDIGTATAAADIKLDAAGALTAGTVESTGGDIDLGATTGMTLQKIIADTGNIGAALLGNGSTLELGKNGLMQAGGTLDVGSTGSLVMDTGSAMQAGGAATLQSVGDMQLGHVTGNATSGTAIALTSGGQILGNGDPVNLTARKGGSTSFEAQDDVGAAVLPLVVDVDSLSGTSHDGDIYLHALGDIAIPSLSTPQGDMQVDVDQNLDYTSLAAGGEADIDAGSIAGDQLSTGTDAIVHADADADLTQLAVGGNLGLDAGGDAHIGTGTVTLLSNLDAGKNLAVDTFTGGDDVTTRSGADTTFDHLVLTAGSLKASAGGNLYVTTLAQVQAGSASLDATADMQLAEVDTATDLVADAGGNLVATTLNAGTDGTLTSGAAMTLGTTLVGADLKGTAGSDLTAGTTQVGGDADLQAGGNADLNQLAVDGDFDLAAGGDAHVANGAVDGLGDFKAGKNLVVDTFTDGDDVTASSDNDTTFGNIVLTGGSLKAHAGGDLQVTTLAQVQAGSASLGATGNMQLQEVDTATDLVADAGGNLVAATLNAGADGTLTSGAAMTLGTTTTGDNLDATAGTDLMATTLNAGANGTLTSGAAMTLGATVTGVNLDAAAGTDLLADTTHAGGNADLTAADAITLTGATTTGGNLEMLAGQHMGFAGIDAGGHVLGQSLHGSIDGDSVTAASWIRFIAAGDIRIGNLVAGTDVTLDAGNDVATTEIKAGHDVDVDAGGDVTMLDTHAGHDVGVDAGGALTLHTMVAGSGIDLAADTMSFGSVSAPDTITLLARGGDITGASLTTRDAYASALGDIALDAAYIGNRINLAARDIRVNITQTSTGQPLYSRLTGYRDGVARYIQVYADAPDQWLIDRLAAVNAALRSTAPRVDITEGHIEQTMSLETADARVWMDQQDPTLVPADVQLMQPTEDFQLAQDGVHSFGDSFVIRYGYGYQIQTPNYVDIHQWLQPDYEGDAALRFNGRVLTTHTGGTPGLPASPPTPVAWPNGESSPVQTVQGQPAVNIEAPR